MSDTDISSEDSSESQLARHERSPSEASNTLLDSDIPCDSEPPRRTRILVTIPTLPTSQAEQYEELRSEVVEKVVEEIVKAGGRDLFYQIEFRDGRHDIVSPTHYLSTASVRVLTFSRIGVVR